MAPLRRPFAAVFAALSLSLALTGTFAAAQDTAVSKLRDARDEARPNPVKTATDAGRAAARTSKLSAEDKEVVENLELLENLDQSDELDLLVELSKED